MEAVKYKQDYELIRNEYQVCKQKLDSKCEALLILTRDLDRCRQERDQFKLMAEQVQQRYQALRKQLGGVGPRSTVSPVTEYAGMKQQNMAQLLSEMRECNKTQQLEVEDLKQKLLDAQGDIKLLREQIVRQRVGTTDEGINTRHFPAHEREDLVKQLESAREQVEQLERDVQQVIDEKEEQETERDVYKNKYERLNTELNYVLKGGEKRIVDIDALLMENKYLNQRISQVEEEKSMAMATVSKYKSLLEKRKNKGILKLGQNRSSGIVISQKQVRELLSSEKLGGHNSPTPQMVADLQSLATALLETVNDKNLALQHQRKTNKILSERMNELEKKLKTLEVSGLWSVTGKQQASLDKLKLEGDKIKAMLPKQSAESGDSLSELADQDTADCSGSTSQHSSQSSAHTLLQDLDFLPTKDTEISGTDQSSSNRQQLGTGDSEGYFDVFTSKEEEERQQVDVNSIESDEETEDLEVNSEKDTLEKNVNTLNCAGKDNTPNELSNSSGLSTGIECSSDCAEIHTCSDNLPTDVTESQTQGESFVGETPISESAISCGENHTGESAMSNSSTTSMQE